MDDDRDDHEAHLHGFALPLPASLGQLLVDAHSERERGHIETDVLKTSIYAFLDSLNLEQLMPLRRILSCDGESRMNNYFEGMVVTIMRLKFDADPDTGLTMADSLARVTDTRGPQT